MYRYEKENCYCDACSRFCIINDSGFSQQAGTVNFNGNILDAACDIDVASKDQVVVLGDYYKTEFPAAGSRTAATKFDIILKNCPVTVTNAKV